MNIALDAMGGDHAPQVAIEGAAAALELFGNRINKLVLVGDEKTIKDELHRISYAHSKIEICHASQVVGMEESAVKSLRQKKDSSISVGADLVKSGHCQALISAGNTGAAVAAATVKMRHLKGVERAGIASPLPNEYGPCNIIDAGANVEAKASHLLQYAIMGSVYAEHVQGKKNPVVGLMSVGEEDSKGTEFTREVFELLKDSGLNFKGNVEGHDLFETKLDVVVCDGFVGNIVLKSCEATVKVMFKWLKKEIKRSPMSYFGAALAKNAFRSAKDKGNPDVFGGSPLLGVNGVVIIGHGSSSATAIKNAIRAGIEGVDHGINPIIEEAIAQRSGLM
ncbi:MAG: phosphate acyltransferase PlsX [Verrucomicrobiales bacterium]|nr:phosphate acyltransferase PlsX [Verrucomicrobiales bacterium]